MLKEERFDHILKVIKATNKASFEELALSLNVSEDTVRRDIEVLAKSGLLVKVRGGAISPSASPLSFQDRADMFPDAKKVIALKAQQQLLGAKTVFIDGGTTMLAFISSIPIVANFRLITNNIALLPLLSTHQGIEVIVLGGNYDRSTQTNVGVQTCLEAQKYQADVYFMGACSIDRQIGITASIQDEGEVKKILMASARKTIVLSNKEKLETVDFFKVCELSAIDTLITDLPSNDPALDNYRQFDIEIL
jgi:DeoR/GlpR family transcriptional regulator of sugar metabolism